MGSTSGAQSFRSTTKLSTSKSQQETFQAMLSRSLSHVSLSGEEERIASFQLPLRREVDREHSGLRSFLRVDKERRSSFVSGGSQGSKDSAGNDISRAKSCSPALSSTTRNRENVDAKAA